jgi:WD40 repeat protein
MAEVISPPPRAVTKYWAFISYSHHDRKWGEWLIRALETYRIPKPLVGKPTSDGFVPKRLIPVFRDRDELPGAADLSEKIREAINQSRVLIVICSPNAAHSEWVNKEVLSFKSSGRGSRVLTLIVDGEPNAADADRECFPPAVRYRVNEAGVITGEPAEPLAADARDHGDGRQNAVLKLVAGILEIPYDELRQRERQRARRARRITTAITSSVIAVLVVFLCIAVWQGWSAKKETISALIESSNASFAVKDYWGALRSSLRAVQTFRNLKFAKSFRPDIRHVRPELTQSVQQALYNVKEYKRLICDSGCNFATRESDLGQINWSPDEKSLAFVSGRHVVKLWKPGDNALQAIPLTKDEDEIRSVGWRPLNGKTLLATSSKNGFMKSFDRDRGQLLTSTQLSIGKFIPWRAYLWGMSWRPDGGELVAIPAPNRGVVLLAPDNTQLDSPPLTNPNHPNHVYRVSWGPQPKPWLAAGDLNFEVRLFDPENRRQIYCDKVSNYILSVAWRPDGTALAVGLSDGTVQLFNVEPGSCTKGPLRTGLDGNVSGLSWGSGGQLATASDEDKEIRWWGIKGTLSDTSDIPTDTFYMPTVPGGVQWSPDGEILAVLDKSGSVRLLKGNQLLRTLTAGSHAIVKTAALNLDGDVLAAAVDGGIYLWRQAQNHTWQPEPFIPTHKGDSNAELNLESISWSPDGKLLAYATDKGVMIRDREAPPTDQPFGDGGVSAISWNLDGNRIATGITLGSGKGTVVVWDIKSKSRLDEYDCVDWAQSVAWNPRDKGLLAIGCHNTVGAYLLRWNPETRKFENKSQRHRLLDEKRKEITAENIRVSWSPDGKILAISANNSITLTNNDGEPIRTISTSDAVGKVAWSPDSRMFAVPSGHVVKLFKVMKSSGQDDLPITELKGHTRAVTSVTWDNQTLVSASVDGTVKLWQIDEGFFADNILDKLVGLSCNWLQGYLKNNPLVSKEDSDLQDLCSNAWR